MVCIVSPLFLGQQLSIRFSFTTTNDTCDRGYIGDHCFPILGTEKDETNSNIYRDCVGNRINPWTDCIYTDHIVSKRNFNAIYKKESYIIQGMDYLSLIRFTYPLFVLSTILMAALRSVETVSIALKISILSLIVDVSINYTLIFGKFGFPEMGTKGAAVGTLVARILELVIVVIYLIFADHKLKLFCKDFLHFTKEAFSRFFKILWPSFLSNTLWALATPIQTGILGRLSADAIAANSVSTTMFQYLKVITIGEASASAVLIGTTIGENRGTTKVKEYSKTLQVIYLIIGSVLGISLFFLRIPLLSLYDLTQNAYQMADQILIILSIVMVGMSYQMPTGIGIIKGGGDVKYMMYLNLISTWAIVMPLSFLGAFVWKLPVPMVVLLLNSDQLFKCIPTYLYVKKDKWIKVLV